MNDLQVTYQKERREFGKQCLFSDRKFLMVSMPSNHDEFDDYILRNPVSQGTQLGKQYSLSEVNTVSTTLAEKGVLHYEGGWPKDVNYQDPEQTLRYRRKIEKDEAYMTQIPKMGEKIEACILQNNAVNIFEEYFEGLEPAPIVEQSSARTMYVYKDVETPTRPISHLSWSPDGGFKIAITYCDTSFNGISRQLSSNSYIWETENPNQPLHKLASPTSPSICVEYQHKDINILVSGQLNGQCSVWDVRAGESPVSTTPREICHRESANRVLWINSKTNTEFFSGGADGQVIWWDTRKLTERLESLYMDPEKSDEQVLERSHGVSVLEYEHTIPTRFMVGSEQGMLYFCNRKGKTPMEKITLRMQCHASPIYTLERNPSFSKNFITVGDWNARIWSEDCKESSIIWTKYCSVDLTDGCWSPTKCSLFYLSRVDGNLEAWDLLQQQSEPILTVKISDHSIKCVKPHESGRMIACGCANGSVHLMEVSENMSHSAKNDKAILNTMLDREGKREKILEGKLREIRIKLKKQQEQQEFALRQAEKAADEIKDEPEVKLALSRKLIEDAEREFYEATEEEVQRRIKDQTKPDPEEHEGKSAQKKKRNKSRKVETQEATGQQNEGENAAKKDENGQQQSESASVAKAAPAVKKSSFAEL